MLEFEQQAGISTPITITSSGVLNEVAHGSAAGGANHCSLLLFFFKRSDNGGRRGGFSCLGMPNLTRLHTVRFKNKHWHTAANGGRKRSRKEIPI